MLFEGAQAHHLDVDHGTYPYVTSSNPVAAGACVGSGVGPTRINRVIGIAKAYTTRVGEGPMPTELLDADGERLRRDGAEFGTTTGRPRRCGWFDAVVVEAAARANAFTDIFLTKLDILTGWERIPVCVGYEVDGVRHDTLPMSQSRLPPRRARSTRSWTAGTRTSAAAARSTTCRRTRQAYVEPARGAVRRPDLRHRRRPAREQSILVHDLL